MSIEYYILKLDEGESHVGGFIYAYESSATEVRNRFQETHNFAAGMEAFKAVTSFNINRGPCWVVDVREQPDTNEYGEVSP